MTGGSACCASAPENDATAIKPAIAETFLPELPSIASSTRPLVAIKRNDRGAFICPIPRAPIPEFNPKILHSLLRIICNAR